MYFKRKNLRKIREPLLNALILFQKKITLIFICTEKWILTSLITFLQSLTMDTYKDHSKTLNLYLKDKVNPVTVEISLTSDRTCSG